MVAGAIRDFLAHLVNDRNVAPYGRAETKREEFPTFGEEMALLEVFLSSLT
jgi:hypothetical protein